MKELKQLCDYCFEDELDIDAIVDDYSKYITTVINNSTDNRLTFEDKEEIFSDTFFILWKNWKEIDIKLSLNLYLAGITKNLIKEKYKKLKFTYNLDDFENSSEITSLPYDDDIYDLEEKISKLKKIDKDIIIMFYYCNFSIKDIAKKLCVSELNIKVRLHRIRKKIKSELK